MNDLETCNSYQLIANLFFNYLVQLVSFWIDAQLNYDMKHVGVTLVTRNVCKMCRHVAFNIAWQTKMFAISSDKLVYYFFFSRENQQNSAHGFAIKITRTACSSIIGRRTEFALHRTSFSHIFCLNIAIYVGTHNLFMGNCPDRYLQHESL